MFCIIIDHQKNKSLNNKKIEFLLVQIHFSTKTKQIKMESQKRVIKLSVIIMIRKLCFQIENFHGYSTNFTNFHGYSTNFTKYLTVDDIDIHSLLDIVCWKEQLPVELRNIILNYIGKNAFLDLPVMEIILQIVNDKIQDMPFCFRKHKNYCSEIQIHVLETTLGFQQHFVVRRKIDDLKLTPLMFFNYVKKSRDDDLLEMIC
jgi:hypothetical protein